MYDWNFFDIPESHPISDANNLYEGFVAARKGSSWKTEVQRFRWNWSSEILKLQKELIAFQKGEPNGYTLQPYSKFEISERGITRPITALRVRDRVVKHVLNDLYLIPHIRPKLIYDNGASLKNKGIDFTRRRFIAHLQSFYRKYKTNEGYIRLTDFSGFYDNIDHRLAYRMVCKYEKDEFARKLVKQALESYRIDVSYMTDDEYEKAKTVKFKIVDYRRECHTNENRGMKYLEKSLSVGDFTSQIIAVYYPTFVDRVMKIICGQKYYDRYMDDTVIIEKDLPKLKNLGKIFDVEAQKYKLFINSKKTKICKLSKTFTYLQYRYKMTNDGHVIVKIGKKTIVRMRRKMKKLSVMVMNGVKDIKRSEELFRSWICNFRKVMSKKQIESIVNLYRDLFGFGLDNWFIERKLICKMQ